MSIDEMMDAIAQDTIKASMQRDTEKADVYGKCMDLLAKEEKYAWHDLLKNPEDLPPHGKIVLLHTRGLGFGGYMYTSAVGHFNEDTEKWRIDSTAYPEIIAWKFIEPFEEEA